MYRTIVRSSGDFDINSDPVENVKYDLVSFLQTRPGSRDLDPDYGNPLYQYLHDILNEKTVAIVQEELYRALLKYFPYINDLVVNVQPFKRGSNMEYIIGIGGTIKGKIFVLSVRIGSSGNVIEWV